MFTKINQFLKQRSLFVSLVSNTVKTASADYITQKYIEGNKEIDNKRLALFTSFGLVYLGGWQYYLFNKVFVNCDNILSKRGFKRPYKSAILTFLDLGIHTPLMYYPSFYAIKGYLDNKSMYDSLTMYQSNFKTDLLSIWQLWIPAQMINFTFIPIHLRMPYITCVSFAWTMILSVKRGNNIN
jgi:hypothetical protein